jgi:ATP-binding protein involved in chromosome partitioning
MILMRTGRTDFMLIDLPPVELEIFISSIMHAPVTGAVVVSTPQAVALADAKSIHVFV